MKHFNEYLTESQKMYPFKIGVAGPLPEGFEDTLETCLQKFGCGNLPPGKKTPIQERPMDFPRLENLEVTYYDIECAYPTTQYILQEYVGKCCDVEKTHIIVRNPNEPQIAYQEEMAKGDEEYVAKLTQEDMGGESAQDQVGGAKVMDLLKELETARKERDNDYVGEVPAGESKDIASDINTKAVVGG